MVTMLIVIPVVILGVAGSSATSENFIIGTNTRLKRDLTTPVTSIIWSTQATNSQGKQYKRAPYSDTLSSLGNVAQATTTVNTIPTHNPLQSVTYNPYQYHGISTLNQDSRSSSSSRSEIPHKTTSALPSFHGGFQASPVQSFDHHIPQDGYNKKSASHTPHISQRYQNKVLGDGNVNFSEYFGAPSSYKFVPESSKVSPIRASSHPTSGSFPSFSNFKSPPAILSSSSYDDHTFSSHPKNRFSPSTTLNTHSSPLSSSSQSFKAPIYRSGSYPGSKNRELAPSSYSSEFSSTPSFAPFDKDGHTFHQYGSSPGAGYPNKKGSVPISLQLNSSPEVSGLVKTFENEPVLLSTGPDYQSHPSSGPKFDFPKGSSTSHSHGPSPFKSPVGNYQSGASSVHSSRGNLQIPQYKTASSNSFNSNEYSKPTAGGYQLLAHQPQLHFTTGSPLHAVSHNQPIIYHSKPFEQIRSDAEVIDKKRLTTPRPYESSDENDFEEGFKTVGRDFGYFANDDSEKSRSPKVSAGDSSFEIPRSNLFSSYDEAFGKYSKLASIEKDKTEKRVPVIDHSSKPVYQSIEEEDDNGDSEDKSSGEYRSSYTDERAPNNSYEEKDEEESQKNERLESDDKTEENEDDDHESYKSYGEDFEKDFEDSYQKELPKSDYVHVKEVPEIEESSSNPKKRLVNRTNVKTSRGGKKEKSRHSVKGDYDEPKKYETYTTHRYGETPKNYYRDNEGHSSTISYKSTKSTEPRSDDTYGSKISRDRGTTRYTKNQDSKTSESDEEQEKNEKPINNRETQNRFNKFSKTFSSTEKPLTSTTSSIDTIETYTFSPYSTWKTSKKLSRGHETYGAPIHEVQAIFNPHNSAYPLPQVHQEGLRYFTNGQVVRDLTGI